MATNQVGIKISHTEKIFIFFSVWRYFFYAKNNKSGIKKQKNVIKKEIDDNFLTIKLNFLCFLIYLFLFLVNLAKLVL